MSRRSGWTPERCAAQAAAIKKWRPWEHSTGPRSVEGKARVARNAYRGGQRQGARLLAQVLRQLLADADAVLAGEPTR